MLKLVQIEKDYLSGNDKVEALKGVSLAFRKSEFVSILGPSGCGKTTLLNLIGGLDHYTRGDLVINGKSTKHYHDTDWDAYRNHSIGFVFQNYNLIPHQSVLANVELALTLSGVSKAERRKKAAQALEKVGLGDQIKKRPNQLSGGQMQRVAIARALVNNPDILLADEPTGALDTVTSVQIMELLKEIAQDKLVIMVTHNPDLAEEYSTRIIKLLDGRVTHDSNPFEGEEEKSVKTKEKKTSMSLFTALSLSMNNLMTKKGRTILTSFAGSIGIIGIALILALSNGINAYINSVQEETLSGFPIAIEAESVDMSALMLSLMGSNMASEENQHELDAVYSSTVMSEMINAVNNAEMKTNNLTLFKEFLDGNEEIRQYISNLQYSYDLNMSVLTKDENGVVIESDVEKMMMALFEKMGFSQSMMGSAAANPVSSMGFSSIKLWQEMLPDTDGGGISPLMKDQYECFYGNWPEQYNEVVLVVNKQNELSDLILCGMGLISFDEAVEDMMASQRGETLDTTKQSWSYEDICNKEFKILLPSELYQKNVNGTHTLLTDAEKGKEYLFSNPDKGVSVRISGIIRPKEDNATLMSGALGYTADLTQHLLNRVLESDLIQLQKDNPEHDVLLNLPFIPDGFTDYSEEEKIVKIKEYLGSLDAEEKARIYCEITSTPSQEYLDGEVNKALGHMTRGQMEEFVNQFLAQQETSGADASYIADYLAQMSDEELYNLLAEGYAKEVENQYKAYVMQSLSPLPKEQLAGLLDLNLAKPDGYSNKQYLSFYETYMPATFSKENLESNLKLLGWVDEKSPSVVRIFATSFENKDRIADAIEKYNVTKDEDDKIEYTDYFAILMSSISTIINAISYVLVAFVSISLVVSSIMIGIITYISVLERTKEIGILRAIGASKKDISRVFNAESVIEGFAAGIIGIGITLLLIIPINLIIRHLTGIPTLGAALPWTGYLLIAVSVILSFIAGLLPSRMAANKDPVVALRTE